MNSDFKKGCQNEFNDNNEKSCSSLRNEMNYSVSRKNKCCDKVITTLQKNTLFDNKFI